MYCKACGGELQNGQDVCLKCGVKAGNGAGYCANCGSPVNAEADVCLKCGFAVKAANSIPEDKKMTMFIICFFLGVIGVHNFMLGETKKGIVKIVGLFCFGISGILVIIDLIKIATDKYVIDPTKMF